MFEKIKEFFGWIVAIVISIIGILVYIINRKDEQLDVAKAQQTLHEADKESAVINTKIENLEKDKKTVQADIDKADTKLVDLSTKKEQAKQKEKKRKPDEVEDYWNN